ncbi:MAG TPA: hypothetical protein PL048_18155, partial [Leptospiraceae bacterium]|nr:hypothetical protein [Leptospiraceae bacterium]
KIQFEEPLRCFLIPRSQSKSFSQCRLFIHRTRSFLLNWDRTAKKLFSDRLKVKKFYFSL